MEGEDVAQEGGCENLAGIIVGSVLGTFLLCMIVSGVLIYIMWRKYSVTKLRYMASARNGVDRQFSTVGSVIESGLHNAGYVADNSDMNDVIMMMDTKQNGTYERTSTARRRLKDVAQKNMECVEVKLIGKDVSGLGFDVKGNPREGISISHISERGAARENHQMKVGDKVISLTISFDNMVYEDALTLLSYASPYPITMVLGKKRKAKSVKENSDTLKSVARSKAEDEGTGSLSSVTKSPDHSDNQSEGSMSSRCDKGSLKRQNSDPIGTDEEDTDDDTRKRAPSHLPQNIKSLVESKKSAKQAVEVIEDHSKHQILSPTGLESEHGLKLSVGAQSALELILNKHATEDTVMEGS